MNRAARHLLGVLCTGIAFAVIAVPPAAAQCPGDCGDDGVVSINELIRAVNIALGRGALEECQAADVNRDGAVRITELVAAVNAALGGCPPAPSPTPTATATATVTASPTPPNDPPVIAPMPVYRSYPGFAITYAVPASDPEGGAVQCTSANLPTGATLDSETAVFAWTPNSGDVGGYDIAIRCTDDDGGATERVLPVQITPLDTCSEAVCDPATGCEPTLLPVAQECCTEEPTIRVREPAAECMPGLVLYAGRNQRGFGRLQNCDLLQISPSGQGSTDIRFNIEARCVDSTRPLRLAARMETADRVLFDRQMFVNLTDREDGFAQQSALFFRLELIEPDVFDGAEVQLDLRLTDTNAGVVVEHTVRLTLTTSALGDLPEPDVEDISPAEAGCVGCHRPLTTSGERFGIEEAHPWAVVACTECHGGNGSAFTRADAHVAIGAAPPYLKAFTSAQLDAVDRDYLRFVNPGDLRVAPQTCGSAGCHAEVVAAVAKSHMSTYGALYTVPRYLAGMQGADSIVGAIDISDPDYDPETSPPGAIAQLSALRGPTSERFEIAGVIDDFLPKACPTCHLNAYGASDAPGLYRSSGCTACHMLYADDGRSRTTDPMITKSFPSHPAAHRLTSAIPVEQCAHCHHRGGRIGLGYRGIREGGYSPELTPVRGQVLASPLYGNAPGFYFSDEDTANTVDETPPDVHFTAGMVCVDCHVGADVHGDGFLSSFGHDRVGIRCEDCHGTIRAAVEPDEDGVFQNSAGHVLKRLRRDDLGVVQLRLAMEDRELAVTQIAERIATNPRMAEAMGVDENGFSHTDSIECYTCHSTWRQTCFGCHAGVDDRGSARNWTTGEMTQGAISTRRDTFSLDFLALGVNERGKITPLAHGMSMSFSYTDPSGTTVLEDVVRTTGDGALGFGWSPFFHHTVSRVPQNCDRCHALDDPDDPSNAATLRETYGFGNGQAMIRDGSGLEYDATAFLDESGETVAAFPGPATGPVPVEVRERAAAIVVTPQPR